MKTVARNRLWFGLALVLAISLLWEFMPVWSPDNRLGVLPTSGLGLTSRDLPLNETEAQVYRQARVVKRVYQVTGQQFLLIAIDGSRDRHAVHDPLYCFRGAGWNVRQRLPLQIPGGVASHLLLTRSGQTSEAVFWFSDGRHRHVSVVRAWWQSAWRRLTFGRSGHEPVLIVLQPIAGETVDWNAVLSRCPFLFEI
jgi:hypothetical protein